MAVPVSPPITPRLASALADTREVDVDRQRIDWAPYAWRDLWELKRLPRPDVVKDLIDLYFDERTIPRSYLYDLADKEPIDIERLLIATLAWGYGTDGKGRSRSSKTLLTQTEPPRTPFEVAAGIVATVRANGAKAGFSALFKGNVGRLSRMGTSFGTKLLHFAAYRAALDPPPLIFDSNAYKGFVLEQGYEGFPHPRACFSTDYLEYCTWCQQVAAAHRTSPAVVEYCLFSIGRDGRAAAVTPY